MTRLARRILSASTVLALAVGVLLAPTRAGAAGPSLHERPAAPARQQLDPGELQLLLDQIVAAGAPGAAAVVRDGGIIQLAASGVADLRTGRAMQPRLHFRAASLTKSLVAAVVLQLVAEVRLSLSDTMHRWLPGVLPYGDQVSIRQLLSHTSGVPGYQDEPILALYGSWQGRFRVWTPARAGRLGGQPAAGLPAGYGLVILQHRLRLARLDRGGGHRQQARSGAGPAHRPGA